MATSSGVIAKVALSPAGVDGLVNADISHQGAVPPALLATLRETHRQRQDFIRAEVRLTNQIEAIHRRFTGLKREERGRALAAARKAAGGDQARVDTRGWDVPAAVAAGGDNSQVANLLPDVSPDAPGEGHYAHGPLTGCALAGPELLAREAAASVAALPLHDARDLIKERRRAWDKALERQARELPVKAWAAGVRGLGVLSLGQIIGETGDLSLYANPAKVWKRMGLAVIDGERQRKHSDPELAALHGYDPTRRALMYVVADNLVKLNDGAYRAYYDAEKARQREKCPEARAAAVDARARRHLAKRLLRDLWRAWRTNGALSPSVRMFDHEPTDPAESGA